MMVGAGQDPQMDDNPPPRSWWSPSTPSLECLWTSRLARRSERFWVHERFVVRRSLPGCVDWPFKSNRACSGGCIRRGGRFVVSIAELRGVRRVIVLEMKGRIPLLAVALATALAGCTTSPGDHSLTIDVRSAPSKWTSEFTVAQAGTYSYSLTYAPHCAPIAGFALISPENLENVVRGPDLYSEPPKPIPTHETGSVHLSKGKWTGISGNGDPTGSQISPPVPSARLPIGGYWAAGCSWSLALTLTS